MPTINRREFSVALAALAALPAASAQAKGVAVAEESTQQLSHSQLFQFEALPVHTAANGTVSRSVLRGTLPTGEYVEVHETTLPPGKMPHPPHRHTHSEFLLIREGTLEVDSGGKRGAVHAGGVVFTASGVLHSLKNIGQTPANYFVVAVGVQRMLP